MHIDTPREQGSSARKIAGICAIIIVLVALFVPMSIFGMYFMFTVHMVQHLLLSLAVPSLFLLSIPSWRFRQFFRRMTHG